LVSIGVADLHEATGRTVAHLKFGFDPRCQFRNLNFERRAILNSKSVFLRAG
jgi:hypothetical protein